MDEEAEKRIAKAHDEITGLKLVLIEVITAMEVMHPGIAEILGDQMTERLNEFHPKQPKGIGVPMLQLSRLCANLAADTRRRR